MPPSPSADDRPPERRSSESHPTEERSSESRSITTALAASARVLRDRPGAILVAYLLALGTLQVAIAPAVLGLAVAIAALSVAGRLGPAIDTLPALADAAGSPGVPADPAEIGVGGEAVPPAAIDALSRVVTPASVGGLLSGIVGAFLAWMLARAATRAITQGTVWAALDDSGDAGDIGDIGEPGRGPLVEGLVTAGRWRTFLGLFVLRVGVPILALLPALAVLGVAGVVARGSGGGAGLALAGIAGLVGVLLAAGGALLGALLQFLLLFAGPAAVIDDRGTLGAARASLGFVRSHLLSALAFGLVVLGGYVALSVLAALLSALGAAGVLAPVLPLVLSPLLDTIGTALYAGSTRRSADRADSVNASAARPLRSRVARALRCGVGELGAFPRAFPLATLVGVLSLAGAIAAGYALTSPYGVAIGPPGEVATVFGTFPVDTFATLAVNNWVVSARLAFGGVALAVPAIVGLAFNGLLVGGLAGISDPVTFLALVAPHGILELPTVALAGGAGIHLGRVGWRALRGRADARAVAEELWRAGLLLVGIALLLIVAAFVEAFLTPRIAAAVIG